MSHPCSPPGCDVISTSSTPMDRRNPGSEACHRSVVVIARGERSRNRFDRRFFLDATADNFPPCPDNSNEDITEGGVHRVCILIITSMEKKNEEIEERGKISRDRSVIREIVKIVSEVAQASLDFRFSI